ncbi:MAG: prolipoprotein diacylglyceryl transferase [Gemmatimonadaceae bacterium]
MILQADPIVHHPFAFDIGPLQFTGFGLAVLLGFVIAQIIATRELERRGHDATPMGDLVFASVIGALIGAKLYYAILTGDPGAIFSRAGFVFWGGLIGGIIVTLTVIRMKKLSIMRISDVAGIGIAAAYSVGRTGCWAVGDDYGRPWNSALAVAFPEGAPPSTAASLRQLFGLPIPADLAPSTVLAVHPTQLYETALAFGMFLILWKLRDHKHAEGWLFGVYCVLAGLERFVVEFFRAKDDRFFGVITMAQVIAIGFILLGSAWMLARREKGAGKPGIYAESVT